MKSKLFLLFQLAFLYGASQCPDNGLQVVSEACEAPQNAKVSATTCNRLSVEWLGKKNQQYQLKAVMNLPQSDEVTNAELIEMHADNNGLWRATLAVLPGREVNWSVQSLCTAEGAAIYSYPLVGPKTLTPVCDRVAETSSNLDMRVYPNPSNGILTVYYPKSIAENVIYSVYDATGKKAYYQSNDNKARGNNSFQLNLRNLLPGNYLLKVKSGNELHTFKFVLLGR